MTRVSGCLLALVLAGGCGIQPYKAKPLVPGDSAASLSARSLQDEGLHKFVGRSLGREPAAWPPPKWDLESLSLAAYYFQPDLDVARAEWNAAAAARVTASERPNPSISAGATYNSSTPPPWIPGISFDIPFETAGKRGHRTEEAKQLSESARWSLLSAIWQTRSRVRAALLQVYSTRRSETLLGRQEEAQAQVVKLLEGQLAAGSVSATEVTQARIALDTTRLARQQARGEAGAALADLAGAIGVPSSALDGVALSFAGLDSFPSDVVPPDVRRRAMLERSDVRAALADYAASEAALQLEIANQYPDIHLGPGYEYDQTDNKWTLGVGLTLPVFNRNQGPIAEARAKRDLSAKRFLAVQAKALADVDSALAAYAAAGQQSAIAGDLERELKRRLDSAEGMEKAGEVDALTVANALVEYNAGAVSRLDAQVRAQQAMGRVEDAVQSPLILPASVVQNAAAGARESSSMENEP